MPRIHSDWINAYLDYAKNSEAPKHMHFWVAVSAVAGALRRKVWIDQAYFRWYPNFYICLVAPPGIVSKSTTADVGMRLLRQLPDIKFGPDIVTWPALVEAFADSTMAFEYQGAYHPMSAMTLESSEFGNLLDPQDKQMVDLMVSLWDGKQGAFKKETKHSGKDTIENPWINMIACTTPSWIAQNFPEYMIGGGFTSRTIFVYAEEKARMIAYPSRIVDRADLDKQAADLVTDLCRIGELVGEFKLTEAAYKWGEEWYARHYAAKHSHLDRDRFGGYLARKQTHIHKLAMVLSAAMGDSLIIDAEHLAIADSMVTDLEPDMAKVFAKIGKTDTAIYAERLLAYVATRPSGGCSLMEAYKYVHQYFPSQRDFEDVLAGLIRAGYLRTTTSAGQMWLHFVAGATPPQEKAV
jgi:hypothetical protein